MSSELIIWGYSISLYGLFFYLGIGVSAGLVWILYRHRRSPAGYDIAYSAVYAMIGAMVGAKLLFLIVSARQLIALNLPWYAWIKGGFVFYGGMLGGIIGLYIYTRQFRLRFYDFLDIYAAVLPAGHGLGRIGCYFAGCCYGRPWDGPGAVV